MINQGRSDRSGLRSPVCCSLRVKKPLSLKAQKNIRSRSETGRFSSEPEEVYKAINLTA